MKVERQSRARAVFERYSAPLRRFISRQLSSDAESEDLLHDLFYKFIVTDGEEEVIENVSSWLYRVARNLVIDRSRTKREQPMPYLKQGSGDELREIALADLLSVDIDTEDELFGSLIREELQRALAELPVEQRKVFELNELQGVEFREISEATGVPINTLISRKRYAVLHLRERLQTLREELNDDF